MPLPSYQPSSPDMSDGGDVDISGGENVNTTTDINNGILSVSEISNLLDSLVQTGFLNPDPIPTPKAKDFDKLRHDMDEHVKAQTHAKQLLSPSAISDDTNQL
jgi:hypothetical protein